MPPELEAALNNGPFERALGLAIATSGLTLARLEYHLNARGHHIGRSTLSYWQQGRRRPERPDSLLALRSLEDILGLPTSSLSSLLGPRRPRGRWIGYRPGGMEWSEMWEDAEGVQRVLAAGSRRENNKVEEISVFEAFGIGGHREKEWQDSRKVVRAREDGADRHVLVYYANPDIDVRKIDLINLENCRLGRRRFVPEARLAAFELLFDRSLSEGQSHLYGYRMQFPPSTGAQGAEVRSGPSATDTLTGRVFRFPVHSWVLQAQFTTSMLPVRCFWIRFARVGSSEQIVGELPITAQNTAHISLENTLPSVQGIRWEWE